MDKTKFLKNYTAQKGEFEMPDGEKITLVGLSVAQRGKMSEVVRDNPVKGQALVVCMSADFLTEDDIDDVLAMDGKLVADIADKIMILSGLNGEEKN